MNHDDIYRMAREAGLDHMPGWMTLPAVVANLERFAALVAASEREECARVVEPEPVAWITDGGKGELWWYQSLKYDEEGNLIGYNPDDVPLYTAPPQRKPLTDEEIRKCCQAMGAEPLAEGWPELIKFARAIERAHGVGGEG